MTKLFVGMILKSSKTGKTYIIESIAENQNRIYLNCQQDNDEAESHILNKVVEFIDNGYYTVINENKTKSKTIKLSNAQQKVYDEIMKAERQIIIDNPNANHPSEKTIYEYINNDGIKVRLNSTKMWTNSNNNKHVHMYKGHSTTLKALESKGLIKLIEFGGMFDIVEVEREAPEREMPSINKYRVEAINCDNKTIVNYYFAESLEGIQKYINADNWYNNRNGYSYCESYKIFEDKRDFEVRYNN